jgi:hypothetical protein
MSSIPPPQRTLLSQPRVRLDRQRLARAIHDEQSLCVVVEEAAAEALSTRTYADGTVVLRTDLFGALGVGENGDLVVRSSTALVRVKLALPDGIDFTPLAGAELAVSVGMTLGATRALGVDLGLRDDRGALLFWARDGELPRGGEGANEFQIRTKHGEVGSLVVASEGAVASVGAPGTTVLRTPSAAFVAAVLRVDPSSAAFAISRV